MDPYKKLEVAKICAICICTNSHWRNVKHVTLDVRGMCTNFCVCQLVPDLLLTGTLATHHPKQPSC